MNNVLFALALGLPLGLLLACTSLRLQRSMLRWLWLAPLPALLLSVLADSNGTWTLGNAQFALHFAQDMPGRILLGSAALLWSVAGMYAVTWLYEHPKHGGFVVTWLMTLSGMIGVFLAADLIGFYLFLAMLTVGASGMVLQGQGEEALRASAIYLGLALLAEAFFLTGLVLLALSTPDGSLLIRDAVTSLSSAPNGDLIMSFILIGLGMKAGLVPLHFWLPLAHGAAPMPSSAVLSGVVVKIGLLGMLRFLPLDIATPSFGLPLAAFGLLGALYGVAIGLTQSKPKVILAYSSVSQISLMAAMIGMGLAAGVSGTAVAVAFYAVHHLLVKGALFLAVGVVVQTGRKHLGSILLPAAFIALGLGGLALTGGALAKYATKDLLGVGLAGAVGMFSSIATALLMIHFLRSLLQNANTEINARPPNGLVLPWLGMAVAAIAVPWMLYLLIPINTLAQALAPGTLWDGLWPLLIGVLLAIGLERWKKHLPAIPAGDIASLLMTFGRANAALGAWSERFDYVVRRWVVATITLIMLVILFVFALK